MSVRVIAVDRPELPPHPMPDRFRHDVSYFMAVPGEDGVPALASGEYWIRQTEAVRILDDGVLVLVSPLDSHHHTEVELSAEQEEWLEWMIQHGVERVRIE